MEATFLMKPPPDGAGVGAGVGMLGAGAGLGRAAAAFVPLVGVTPVLRELEERDAVALLRAPPPRRPMLVVR